MTGLVRFTVYALAVAVPLSVGSVAQARGTIDNDSYVEGGLAMYPDVGTQDFIGPEARARVAVHENWFAFGGLQFLSDDLDYTSFHVGGAYRLTLPDLEALEIWGGPTIEYQEVEYQFLGNTNTDDEMSLGVHGGVRYALNPKLELNAEARLVTGDWDYLGVAGQANYALTSELDVYGRVDNWDGDLGIGGGVRYSF